MLPKRVPLQIYVQETLQKSASFRYSLLVGGRSMFSLDPYIIAQIAPFHVCEHPASLDDFTNRATQVNQTKPTYHTSLPGVTPEVSHGL